MGVTYRCGQCGQRVVFSPADGETDPHVCPPTRIERALALIVAKLRRVFGPPKASRALAEAPAPTPDFYARGRGQPHAIPYRFAEGTRAIAEGTEDLADFEIDARLRRWNGLPKRAAPMPTSGMMRD